MRWGVWDVLNQAGVVLFNDGVYCFLSWFIHGVYSILRSGWTGSSETVSPAVVVFGGTKGMGWWWFEVGARVGRLREITTTSASSSSQDVPSVHMCHVRLG